MKKNLIIATVLGLMFAYYSFDYIRFEIRYYEVVVKNGGTQTFIWSNYIYPTLLILNLLGLLQFIRSKYKSSGLLRIYLQLNLLISLTSVIYYAYVRIFPSPEISQPTNPIGIFDFINYAYMAFEIFALITLQNGLSPVLRLQEDGNLTFDDVAKFSRFLNRLFDAIIIVFIFYLCIQFASKFSLRFERTNEFFIFAESRFYVPITILGIFYYLISETVFNTTIGKTIMGNMVVNSIAEKPSIIQRIGRTFARIIPFDALSYLFGERGWHDRIANTYVVKIKKNP